ncbi:MAG: nicotinate-nucleotide adenylyltransferase [Bacteroidales bacterium]|nr:nicotinate-nucleotide adenylyltransferase [Bacteroidales bacterium]
MRRKTALFFGSFNPVHNGHLMLANYLVEYGGLDDLWFVVSPHNPFKDKETLLDDRHRLRMLELAVEGDERFEVSDIEFYMPKPSYTIDTLVRLSERHPNNEFYLVCGLDNLKRFPKWKNADVILRDYHILVYPRKGFDGGELLQHPHVHLLDAPEIEVSSTFIRNAISEGRDVRYFVPEKVYKYIDEMRFYR